MHAGLVFHGEWRFEPCSCPDDESVGERGQRSRRRVHDDQVVAVVGDDEPRHVGTWIDLQHLGMDDVVERLQDGFPISVGLDQVRRAGDEMLEPELSGQAERLLARHVGLGGDFADNGCQLAVGVGAERRVGATDVGALDHVVPRVSRQRLGDNVLNDVEQHTLHLSLRSLNRSSIFMDATRVPVQ